MSVEYECDSCKRKYKAPDHTIGKKVKCPKCKHVGTVQENFDALDFAIDEADSEFKLMDEPQFHEEISPTGTSQNNKSTLNKSGELSLSTNESKNFGEVLFGWFCFFSLIWLCISCAGCPDIGGWKIQSMCYNIYTRVSSIEVFQTNTDSKSKIVIAQDKVSQNPILDITQSIQKMETKKKTLEEALSKSRKSSEEIIGRINILKTNTDQSNSVLILKPLKESLKLNVRQIRVLEVRLGEAEAAIFNTQIKLREKELSNAGFSDDELSAIKQDLLIGEEVLDGSRIGKAVPELSDEEVDKLINMQNKK